MILKRKKQEEQMAAETTLVMELKEKMYWRFL